METRDGGPRRGAAPNAKTAAVVTEMGRAAGAAYSHRSQTGFRPEGSGGSEPGTIESGPGA